ncbi:MAG: tRNA-binding protein [Nanoarchaeota archaeon]|nr:tRNA-binding protein [Nanoarchaeota archaeon]
MITWQDFEKVDMRVGTIVKIEDFPEARNPAYKLTIDFGELGIKKSSAQITKLYKKEDLINKQIIAVVNFPPKQIADFVSEVLVLGVVLDNKDVVLIKPDNKVKNGLRIA